MAWSTQVPFLKLTWNPDIRSCSGPENHDFQPHDLWGFHGTLQLICQFRSGCGSCFLQIWRQTIQCWKTIDTYTTGSKNKVNKSTKAWLLDTQNCRNLRSQRFYIFVLHPIMVCLQKKQLTYHKSPVRPPFFLKSQIFCCWKILCHKSMEIPSFVPSFVGENRPTTFDPWHPAVLQRGVIGIIGVCGARGVTGLEGGTWAGEKMMWFSTAHGSTKGRSKVYKYIMYVCVCLYIHKYIHIYKYIIYIK